MSYFGFSSLLIIKYRMKNLRQTSAIKLDVTNKKQIKVDVLLGT